MNRRQKARTRTSAYTRALVAVRQAERDTSPGATDQRLVQPVAPATKQP